MEIMIRKEKKNDYREVENLTREAFWNLYQPGCDEHFLLHKMRTHKDFIAELDFVALMDDKIVGNIVYTKSYILDENKNKLDTISFGPISVLPEYQRRGIGTKLFEHSKMMAIENNYRAIIIYGSPHNYCKMGFKSSKDFNISNPNGKYPYGMLVYELEKDVLKGHNWKYYTSDVYNIDHIEAEEFDKNFKQRNKEYRYTQEIASIEFRAFIE